MRRYLCLSLLTGVALSAAVNVAHADLFNWNPRAVGLNGSKFFADEFILSDYARIVIDQTGHFVDTGLMPILGFTLDGGAVTPSGFGGKFGSASGWGAYISYFGTGQQTVDPNTGLPISAAYSSLNYQLYGYNGLATFGLGADGTPFVRSTPATMLFAGSLQEGSLEFQPTDGNPFLLTIKGAAQESVTNGLPQLSSEKFTALDVTFIHPPGEYELKPNGEIWVIGNGSLSTGQLSTAKGEKRTALFAAAAAAVSDVPEPATLLLLPGLMLGWRLIGRRTAC